ncbi:hypothetical protein MMC11_007221 [Xylographa trunciseda]|nr:hypothetical protein [Xylographa trunciseda]
MEIPNPRRILILSPPSTPLDTLIKALTGPPPSSPPPPSTSSASPLHHHIHTPYYRATIPIWTDHIPSPSAFHAEWLALPGAADVVSAIGAWIVAFPTPSTTTDLQTTRTLLTTVSAIIAHHSAYGDPPALFAVALPQHTHQLPRLRVDAEAWEEMCAASGGWEFVDGEVGGGGARNEFGEMTGLPRLVEALQTVEWDVGEEEGGWEGEDEEEGKREGDEEGVLGDLESPGAAWMREPIFSTGEAVGGFQGDEEAEKAEREMEGGSGFEGLGGGLQGEEDEGDLEVQALQHMMLKMQAVKEMGADLPEGERRKLAARAVREVMRGL